MSDAERIPETGEPGTEKREVVLVPQEETGHQVEVVPPEKVEIIDIKGKSESEGDRPSQDADEVIMTRRMPFGKRI